MPGDSEAGFTLIEVLVALVMAALLSAILLEGASQARARLYHAADQRRAVFLARTLLTRAAMAPLDQSERAGETNGLKWVLAGRIILPDPRGQFGLVELHLTIMTAAGTQLFMGDARRLKRMPRT